MVFGSQPRQTQEVFLSRPRRLRFDVFDEIDDERVVMTVELHDRGFADAVGAIGHAKLERAHAIDHRQHATAECGQAGDMRRCARDRDQGVEFDDGFDGGRGKRRRFVASSF